MNNVLLKVRTLTDIASNQGSRNLVKLIGRPDVDKSYHTKSTSSKPLSRSQRQLIADKGSSDGGLLVIYCKSTWRPVLRSTFRAALTERCIRKRLPDASYIDKRAGWVTAEMLERSGIREDRCRKQVSGRHVGSEGKAPVAALTLWVACGCSTKGNSVSKESSLICSLLGRFRQLNCYSKWLKKDFLSCQAKHEGVSIPNRRDHDGQLQMLCRFATRNDIRIPTMAGIRSRRKLKEPYTPGNTKKSNQRFTKWRHIRYAALVRSNGCCDCCGATPKSSGEPLHVDHIKPKSLYPELEFVLDNLQILCADCNIGKSNVDMTNWREINEER